MRTKFFTLSLLLMLLSTLVAPIPTTAGPGLAAGPRLQRVGQMGGDTNAVLYGGGQLFTNIGPRIVRMTVADPTAPTLPPTYGGILPGVPEDLKLANGYLYVALGSAGVAVVDPVSLSLLSAQALPFSGFASAVAVGSQRLYAAAGDAGIVAYDLGVDKKTLDWKQTKTFATAENITDLEAQTVTVGGATTESLYVSANNATEADPDLGGVYKFDITSSPTLGDPTRSLAMGISTLDLTDTYIFAAGDTELYALNISTLGTLSTVDLVSPANELCAGANPDLAYLMTPSGIEVVDFTDPGTPAILTTDFFVTAGEVQDLAPVADPAVTYLYVADGEGGLSIASAPDDDPANLTLDKPSYLQPRPGDTRLVTEGGGQAFAFSNADEVWTIPSANPATLDIAGSAITPTVYLHNMTTYANLLLVSAGVDGLQRLEMTPGGAPTGQTSMEIEPGDSAYDTAVAYPNAVVANGFNGLAIVDLATMEVLTRTAQDPQSDYRLVEVSADGQYAYIIDTMDNGTSASPTFRIFDLSTPTAPVQQGAWALTGLCSATGLAEDMKFDDHFVFLACSDAGIKVVDVANPQAAVLLDTAGYDSPGQAQGLSILNGDLYLADGESGVEWLTIDPAGALTLKGSASVNGTASQVAAAANGYVYVATGASGVQVFQQAAATSFQLFLPIIIH